MEQRSMVKLSNAELMIMTYLWDSEEDGKEFADILDHFRTTWTKQTLNTFLKRIDQKGLIRPQGDRGRRRYYIAVSREDYITAIVDEILPGAGERIRLVL